MEGKSRKRNKRSQIRNRLLCYLMSGALALTNLAVMPAVSVSAAESAEQDNGNQETIVKNYKELVQAIDEAGDGDVIGIDNIIELNSDVSILGSSEKRLTICRMSENSYIVANLSADVKVENIIFDGRGVAFDRCYVPMFQVEGKVNFENVTFQNCYNNWSGGAIIANGGEMNITGCHFKNNRASEGGHIVVQSAKVSVQNSVFENGVAENGGGAVKVELIYGYDNGIEFNNCKLVGNQAKFGGAIANKGNVKITNSVLYGNQAKSAADIINYVESSFQIDSIAEVIELYKESGITPKEWIYDYDNKSYISGEIDKTNPNAALRLVYDEISEEMNPDGVGESDSTGDSSSGNNGNFQNEDKKDDSDSENGGSEKDESKGDTTETEQPKDDNNGDDSAADNKDNAENKKDENDTGGDTIPDNGNTGDSNSEQNKSEEDTADSDSNKNNDDKENGSTEDKGNQDKQENQDNVGSNENNSGSSSDSDNKDSEDDNHNMSDTSAGNDNQTSNPSIEKPNTGNNGSTSGSTPSSSEGNRQPDSTVNYGNQSGVSVGNKW